MSIVEPDLGFSTNESHSELIHRQIAIEALDPESLQHWLLRVDRFVGQQEIYVKPVPELLSDVRTLAEPSASETASAAW